jgi:hypothetical protein
VAATLRAPAPLGMQRLPGNKSVIGQLRHIVKIGSTVDPINGDQNPYGLEIAPSTNGMITAGDLVICNFNDSNNIQGLGTTIEVLHPQPGSSPARLIADPTLTGCDALALAPNDTIWAAALDANDNPIVSSSGSLIDPLNTVTWNGPWAQAFSPTAGPRGVAAFYESNAYDGTIVRINITKNGRYTFDTIATGFSVNHGVPGTILAPSGFTYDAQKDILYIVDGNVNALVAIANPGTIPRHGIVRTRMGFTGPAAKMAKVIFQGPPLNAPISAAELFNGNIVIGNTTNNHLIEIDPKSGKAVGNVNLDKKTSGALFGIAATGTSMSNVQIFFNDDNQNAVNVLQP